MKNWLTDTRSSMNYKQDKHKGNHVFVYHSQSTKTKGKGKS